MHAALARPPGSSSSTSAAALRHRPPPPPSPSPAARAIAAASSAPNPPMRVSDSADCVDGAVGTIVWVRRRNGSWWPGRILGPEELSASHVMSPRSGTPVKLLGREDASVDWYNLEKSKRVKAFRCGEFDACIERAEASQGIPIKKREKYARREDAILHALELEMQQEMKLKKPGNISDGISNKTSGAPTKELSNFSSEAYMRNDDPGLYSKSGSLKYHQIGSSKGSSKTVVPHEEDNISKSLYIHKMKSSKKLGCKEDTSEAIPQMRGLQDFDLQIAPSKRKLSHSVTWETSGKPVNNNVDILSGAWHNMAGAIHTGGSKSSISIKRKRSDDGMVAETLFRKRDGHQPLVQVVHNSAAHIPISHSSQLDYDAGVISREDETNHMDAVCRAKQRNFIYLPANSNESLDHSGYHSEEMDNSATQFRMDDQLHRSAFLAEEYTSSALIEATESDSSDRVSREDEMEEGNVLRDKCVYMNKEELPLSSCISQLHLHEKAGDTFADIGVYSWHIKGRRNSRNFAKRAIDETGRKFFINVADKYNGSAKRMVYGGKGHSFKMGRMECLSQRTSGQGLGHKKEFSRACDRDDLVDMNLGGIHLSGHGSRKYPFPLLAAKDSGMSHSSFNDSDSDSQLIAQSGWEADGPSHATARMYWGESDDSFEPVYTGHINDETESMLVDVDLKVKAMYQGEHVPLVSLMSRLNGKAIIGHPVHVEILEDGSSGHVFSGCLDESIAPTAVWTTARRTAMQRIPRSQPETSAFESEDTELIQYSDCENKSLSKEYSSHFSHQAQIAKKSISHACRPMPGKSHKKPPKRVSLFSNQKTRTLSSFANDQKRRRDNTGKAKLSRGGNIFGSMINPEAVVPLVTRVPVKVVFSRILEAIRRPSTASANRVRMTSPAVRDPS